MYNFRSCIYRKYKDSDSIHKTENNMKDGSKEYFNLDWKDRKEKKHNYFTTGEPETQMQLVFQKHYDLFDKLFYNKKQGKCIEIGCGRGNLSLYHAYHGWNCTLLDQSENAIEVAKENFNSLGFKGNFVVGDGMNLPFEDNTFDSSFNVGLLEHFENADDISKLISEQYRILKNGGHFINYVVPKKVSVQSVFKPLNFFLSLFKKIIDSNIEFKPDSKKLFRSDYDSDLYKILMDAFDWKEKGSFGIFPIPLISYSEIYPFTGLPEILEKIVVKIQKFYLNNCGEGWQCSEEWGQGFIVWASK